MADRIKMDLYEFGRKLIETNDLDPVYVLVANGGMDRALLCRWLWAYFCFYHVGTASWIASRAEYWAGLLEAAGSSAYPRGTERRHFRGKAATSAWQAMRSLNQSPEEIIDNFCKPVANSPPPLATVMNRVKRHRGFGDWIAFKVADMLERLGLCKVVFKPSDVFNMFDSPVQGALLAVDKYAPHLKTAMGQNEMCSWAHDSILTHLKGYLAPPSQDRPINIQEVETILCKWKSHLSGHYEVGKDIKEIRKGLLEFAGVKLCQQLLKGSKGVLWP